MDSEVCYVRFHNTCFLVFEIERCGFDSLFLSVLTELGIKIFRLLFPCDSKRSGFNMFVGYARKRTNSI